MSPPIVSIRRESDESATSTVNALPCRIHFDGSIGQVAEFWKPCQTQSEYRDAYLRGRKLVGKLLRLPENYTGMVVQCQELKPQNNGETERANQEKHAEGDSLHVLSTFDEIVLWTQDPSTNASASQYSKSIEEWLQTADTIHAFQTENETPEN